jgi:hypothetical protein
MKHSDHTSSELQAIFDANEERQARILEHERRVQQDLKRFGILKWEGRPSKVCTVCPGCEVVVHLATSTLRRRGWKVKNRRWWCPACVETGKPYKVSKS